MTTRDLLEVNALKKHFPVRGGWLGGVTGHVRAVDGVTFSIARGETLSLVGESGCGKSTVGKAVLRLVDLTDGEVLLDGIRIDNIPARRLRPLRRSMQIVFQDPYGSLSPRMSMGEIVAEGLRVHEPRLRPRERAARVAAALREVGLPADAAGRSLVAASLSSLVLPSGSSSLAT